MRTSKLLLSSTLFLALISACSTEQEKKKVEFIKIDTIEKNKKNKNLNIHLSPIDTFYNNLTQLLGGKDTVFSFSNNWDTEFIKKYARKVNEKYKKIETNRLKKMGDWNQKNLKRNNQSDTSFVFYPFSGGENSSISLDTKNIFLESALFDPVKISKIAKKLGINSDAKFRL